MALLEKCFETECFTARYGDAMSAHLKGGNVRCRGEGDEHRLLGSVVDAKRVESSHGR